ELVADGIAVADVAAQHLDARGADGDVDRPLPPGAAERIGDHDADVVAAAFAQRLAQGGCRSVGIERQEHEHVGLRGVRSVDARGSADEPVTRFADDQRRADANDRARLLQDRLDPPRILSAGDLARAVRGLVLVEPNDAPFDLRDRLLRDDDDVGLLELDAFEDEPREIVALPELRNPGDREERVSAHTPTMRTPAWPL